jgi:NitT/TauT family transport system permease protein
MLLQGTADLDTTLVFAILFLLTIIGLALNTIVEIVEYFMTPWQRSQSKA